MLTLPSSVPYWPPAPTQEVREATGRTPLCYAAYAGRVAVVRELLAAGADMTTSGKTSLMEAARRGHGSVLEMLLAAGAALDVQCLKNGNTALCRAAKRGRVEAVQLLLAAGADPAMGREKPLAAAAFRGQAAVVSALLAAGVAADARDAAGRTALMYAAMQGHAAVVSAVLEGGADVNARDPQGDTPLLFTAYSQCGARDTQVPPERCISTVQALLAAGADPRPHSAGVDCIRRARCAIWPGHCRPAGGQGKPQRAGREPNSGAASYGQPSRGGT